MNQLYKIYLTLLLLVLLMCGVQAQPAGFRDQVYLNGFADLVGLTFDGNGRMYAYEKSGKVWIVENGQRSATPLLDISEEVGNWRDFGMVGFTLDPNFLSNGHIYCLYVVDRHHLMKFGTAQYSATTNEYYAATIGRVTRYTARASDNFRSVDYTSRKVLLGETKSTGIPILHESHGTGQLVFGNDGTLLASVGDCASYSSVDEGSASETYWSQALSDGIITSAENIGAYRCQSLLSHCGKILRMDPATGNGVSSNPWYDAANPRSARSRAFAMGLRNPYRFDWRPGTGSHNPADGNPGVFTIGDVGWNNREELSVMNAKGMNFGWPKYEGMTNLPGYNNTTYTPSVHHQPKLDWRTGNPRALVNGSVVNVGSASFPGPLFNGNAATGGTWYNGTDFPAEYKGSYFVADYGAGWIRRVTFDANYNPTGVYDFLSNIGPAVCVATHPTTGGLYYVKYGNEIHRITYSSSSNRAPVAFIENDKAFGPGPLTIQFKGEQSWDPENGTLNYQWNFGDGTTSTQMNPSKTYNGTGIQNYLVTLTVTDNGGLSHAATVRIGLNNTPPVIQSTSLDAILSFDPSRSEVLALNAVVTDAEHNSNQLTYAWQTSLYHNDHFHSEPVDNAQATSTQLSPIECGNATYWFRVTLTVTDNGGLSTTYIKDLFPNCPGNNQTINFPAISDKSNTDAPFNISATASSGLPVQFFIISGPAQLTGNTITLTGQPGLVTVRCVQSGNANFDPAIPVERSFWVKKPITTPPPGGNCTAIGKITLDQWFNVGGGLVDDIPLNTTPSNTSEINIFEIPSDTRDNYGVRVRGYICAPQTGNYTFWIASDDFGQLWLSTDDKETNKRKIAEVQGWTFPREWNKYASQKSVSIALVKDQRYYIEALMKEGGGGDNLAVGWQLPNGTQELPIPGAYLSPYGAVTPAPSCNVSGKFTREVWTNVTGETVSQIPVTRTPDAREKLSGAFETTQDYSDNYGVRLYGTLCVPQTGNYTFWIASDDNGELWLSTDNSAANKRKIASVPGYTSYREWTKYPEQKSANIYLEAGKSYYIEALMKEGLVADHLSIGMTLPDGTLERPIAASRMDPMNLPDIALPTPGNCTATGALTREMWTNITGTAIANIPVNATPLLRQSITTGFVAPTDIEDNYGTRLYGYLCVPQTGNYIFWIASDDNGELWLSTDDNATNKRLIASVSDWTAPNEWTKFASQQSVAIPLVAGKKYYIEALMKESTGLDNLSVGWQLPDGTLNRPMSASYLSPMNLPDITPPPVATCTGAGKITREIWTNIAGEAVNLIPLTTTPTQRNQISDGFIAPADALDNYGQRMYGTICVPETGDYTFWISSDDNGELYLSTDDKAANKRRIAYVPAWTALNEWTKYPEQKSALIRLEKGKTYYIEALAKEGAGGDNLSVGWTLPNGTLQRPIPAVHLNPMNLPDITPPAPGNCTATGTILQEVWTNIGGNSISNIPFATVPAIKNTLTIFEIPVNARDNYGVRLSGYICPPVTGNYRFYIASDDNGELWLSTNELPVNKRRIANVTGWTNSRQYNKYASQTSALIYLEAGKSYYVEARMKEGGGLDNLSVGWQLPDGTLERPMPGKYLSPWTGAGGTREALISLEAQLNKNLVDLHWLVNNDTSAAHYAIERSEDALHFFTVATEGVHNQAGITGYQFTDSLAPRGLLYYRIIQHLKNGDTRMSEIRPVFLAIDLDQVQLFPNPAFDEAFVTLRAFAGRSIELALVDVLGVTRWNTSLEDAPDQPYRLELSGLTNGSYRLVIQPAGVKAQSRALIITRP